LSDDRLSYLRYVIGCMYRSLNKTAPQPIDRFRARVRRSNLGVAIHQDFRGGMSDDDIRQHLDDVISQVAHLKDHLKNWLKDRQRDRQLVERFIGRTHSLQIVVDLANVRKHGLLERYRSKHQPRLGRVSRVLELRTGAVAGSRAGFTVDPRTGWGRVLGTDGGGGQVVFTGEVLDKNGDKVGEIMDILQSAAQAWRRFFSDQGIPTH